MPALEESDQTLSKDSLHRQEDPYLTVKQVSSKSALAAFNTSDKKPRQALPL
jgi:hypothetical protein